MENFLKFLCKVIILFIISFVLRVIGLGDFMSDFISSFAGKVTLFLLVAAVLSQRAQLFLIFVISFLAGVAAGAIKTIITLIIWLYKALFGEK